MLTVAEILELDLLPGARVVAGARSLNRPVLWVHNAGVPDAPQWLNGGELVLTTIINLPPDPQSQAHYVHQMHERQVAGLCLTVGKMIDCIPAHIVEAAEACGLPLIEIPYTLRFVDAARAIIERITQGNLDMVRRALRINQQLTQIVLEGGGLHELAAQLAQLVQHSISIETATFDAIATVNIADVDEARRYTQLHGRTDPRLVAALEERGYLPMLRQTLRPVRLPIMADVGLEMERLLAPVVVHGMIYGFMWIIADDHALSEIDLLAIESGATIAALMMLYQETAQAAEASLKGSLLSQLIAGDQGQQTILVDQSLRYGVDLRLPYRLLVIDVDSRALTPLYRQLNQLAAMQAWQVVIGQFAGQIVVLVQQDDRTESVLARIVERLHNGRGRAPHRAGCSEPMQGAAQVRLAHEQAREALAIGQRLYPSDPLTRFEQLGFLHTLYAAGVRGFAANPYVPIVRRLPKELLHTLEVYLETGGSGVLAAEKLHIHRSTLNYRLARIEQICQLPLHEATNRANLLIAVKLLRLFGD